MSRIGQRVQYWKGPRRGAPSGEGVILMEGVMGNHDVVWISGCSGCINVSHIETVPDPVDDPIVLATPSETLRYEIIGMFTPLEASLGWEDTWLRARASLRRAIREGAYADYWIVDRWCGGRIYDLQGTRGR